MTNRARRRASHRATPVRRPVRLDVRKLSSVTAVAALMLGAGLAPTAVYAAPTPDAHHVYTAAQQDSQHVTVPSEAAAVTVTRDNYSVVAYVPPPPPPEPEPEPAPEPVWDAPPAVTPDPGSAQAIAYDMVHARGWGDDQFSCLVALWNRESGWNVNANNGSSGAYGIPQALPGDKMSSAGGDWQTNPATQITWGLGYISGRYGDPCGAWAHSESNGWY